jgi:hypothetical protein
MRPGFCASPTRTNKLHRRTWNFFTKHGRFLAHALLRLQTLLEPFYENVKRDDSSPNFQRSSHERPFQQASPADVAVIQNISAQASRDLNLLQTLCSEYRANPSATTLQNIQNVILSLDQRLPGLLESAHISNATLSTRIGAAIKLILTTVNSFAALIPQNSRTARSAPVLALSDAKTLRKIGTSKSVRQQEIPPWKQAFAQSVLR